MRVLVVPELYRPDDPSANGTLADAVTWVSGWLDRDPAIHVYWLVPPSVPAEDILADCERVTAIRADPFGPDDGEAHALFTEGGYSWAELAAIEREIYDCGAYLDAIIDQRRTGRFDLQKWLCAQTDQWAADVAPFEVIANVHDLQVPFKYRYCDHRNAFQSKMEIAEAVFADGIWFKAGIDAERLREAASDFLQPEVVDAALDAGVETGSPIDCSGFDESYADAPDYLHLAGSLWDKKNAAELLGVGKRLHDEFGVETLLTSMNSIPDEYADRPWVRAVPEADRETYETALRKGDLAVCASEYETMARTPFEQAASGQVLVIRDEPWIYDCVPDDYRFAGELDALGGLAVEAVENWHEAVEANRRLVAHVKSVRDPEASARRTYRDLRQRVDAKRERYVLDSADEPVRAVLGGARGEEQNAGEETNVGEERAVTRSRAEARSSASAPARSRAINLNILREATADHTDDGRPVTARDDYALADLVYALRSLGYRDAGNPGTPVFARK